MKFTKVVKRADSEVFKTLVLGDIDEIIQLLESGVDVNMKDSKGMTPLMWASFYCDYDVVELLLDYDADIDAKDEEEGKTSLMWAAYPFRDLSMQISVMVLLLRNHADINAVDNKGRTALIQSIVSRHNHKIQQILLAYGADVNIKDNFNHNAMDYAIEYKDEELFNLLKEYGARSSNVEQLSTMLGRTLLPKKK